MMTEPNPDLDFVVRLARDAGAILAEGFGNAMTIHRKGVFDVVTEYDHRAEDCITGRIRRSFPDHFILAEESGSNRNESENCWYIDPLDGTVNYSHGVPVFSVSIAYASRGQLELAAVYHPCLDECFSAQRGGGARLNGTPITVSDISDLGKSLLVTGFPMIDRTAEKNNLGNFGHFAMRTQGVRRDGSAALDLCYVAAGRYDGFWELDLNKWDLAAGCLIVQEAGGKVTSADGSPEFLGSRPSVLAANPAMHAILLEGLLNLSKSE